MIRAGVIFILFGLFVSSLFAQTQSYDRDLPSWTKKIGARKSPKSKRIFSTDKFGAIPDGVSDSTRAIQNAIDAAAVKGGVVTFKRGIYVTGALFIKSNVEFRVDDGVKLLASHDESLYPRRPTRVAGIEMTWPSAMINVSRARNVLISGAGTIDGNGQKWWDKYWDLRRQYEPKGLRWASDYDAERVRLMLIEDSSDVTVRNVSLRRSGFWTVQILYSEHVTTDGLKISDNGGPSTDGIDVDSSRFVLIQNCDIDNNDDDICLKAGRDSDGLRVNRPTEYVFIRDNVIRRGAGIVSIGSETSGGIRHVVALNNKGFGTGNAVRLKSAKTRGGYIRDVLVRGLVLENVTNVFSFTLNWNPSYSYAIIPPGVADYPEYWRVLATKVEPEERGWCDISGIRIENVRATGARRIFTVDGLPGKFIRDVEFQNVDVSGVESGSIQFAENWRMTNVRIKSDSGENVKISDSRNVASPVAGSR